jgi:hypothetical protein
MMSGTAAKPRHVVVSSATGTVYVSREGGAPRHIAAPVSLLARDMAGMFVETLSERQVSRLMRHLKVTPVEAHHHHGAHGIHGEDEDVPDLDPADVAREMQRSAGAVAGVVRLKAALLDVGANPSEPELRALSAVLCDTSGDVVHGIDGVLSPAGRLRSLTSNPVSRVWSSEAWHATLKQERRRASAAVLKATQKGRERREKNKIQRLESAQVRFKDYAITSRRVHEKARRHLNKVQNEKLVQYQHKWDRVKARNQSKRKHLAREKREQSIHIEFESMLNRFRVVDMLGPRMLAVCRGMDPDDEGILEAESFFEALTACFKMANSARNMQKPVAAAATAATTTTTATTATLATTPTTTTVVENNGESSITPEPEAAAVLRAPKSLKQADRRLISRVLDPSSTGRLSYGDFLWALRRQRGANGHLVKKQSRKHTAASAESEERLMRDTLKRQGLDIADESKLRQASSTRRGASRQGNPLSTDIGDVVVGMTKVSGLRKARNVCARVDVGSSSWQTAVRWCSDAPVFNQVMASHLGDVITNRGALSISVLECDARGKPKRTIGTCQLEMRSPGAQHGVETAEHTCKLIPPGGLPSVREGASKEERASVAAVVASLPLVHFTTCVLPRTVPAWLVAEKPGHHALGRVRWQCKNHQPPAQRDQSSDAFGVQDENDFKNESENQSENDADTKRSAIAFIFRGVLILATTSDAVGGIQNVFGNLAVVAVYPLWGCSLNVLEMPNTLGKDLAGGTVGGFRADLEILSGRVGGGSGSHGGENNEEGQPASARAILATTRAAPFALRLEILDCSKDRFSRMVEASREYFMPQGGWCPGSELPGSVWGTATFSCALSDTISALRWPGIFTVSKEMCVFSGDLDTPLGAKNIEISLASIENAKIAERNITPPLNALVLITDVGGGALREWTFTSFPGAALALQCILQNSKIFEESVFSARDLKRRRRKELFFPAQRYREKNTATKGRQPPHSNRKKGGGQGKRRGPPAHRRPDMIKPIIQRILGLTIVNNLRPTPPSSPRRLKKGSRSTGAKSPRSMLGNTIARSFEYSLSSPSMSTQKSVVDGGKSPYFNITQTSATTSIPLGVTMAEWIDDFEVLALLGDGIRIGGKGKPFTQLVVHVPSRAQLALQVVPAEAQNMFMLARQSIVALRVNHRNLARCFGTAQVGESIKFLWNYMPERLEDLVSNPIIERLTRPFVEQLVRAIGHLHRLGIMHRNINTRDIFVSPTNATIRLGAFELSKYIGTKGRTRTQCGIPEHLSPERMLGQPHGFGCDWWGVGLVLHDMLAGGCTLFRTSNAETGTTQKQLNLYEQITSCRYFISNSISPKWADVILRLLTKEECRLGCVGRTGLSSSSAEILLYIAANIA